MTTNSPNPVDGDVQALIAFLKEKVASLKLAVKQRAFENVRDELVMDLKSAEISLAALTAEPYAYASRNTDMRKESQYFSASIFNNAWGYEYTLPLYTTPPVQLLRPVELPKEMDFTEVPAHYWDSDEAKAYASGFNTGVKESSTAIETAGIEVKS